MIVGKSFVFLSSVWIYILMLVQSGNGSKVVLANVHLCMMYVTKKKKRGEIIKIFFGLCLCVEHLRNCGQCKEMYGDYFDGQRCAEFCLASYRSTGPLGSWAPMPDCNEPETVDQFLKLSSETRDLPPTASYKPISQAVIGSGYVGRQPSAQHQQNTYYSSKSGAEYKGLDRNWKKRINGKLSTMPRWYFL